MILEGTEGIAYPEPKIPLYAFSVKEIGGRCEQKLKSQGYDPLWIINSFAMLAIKNIVMD